VSLEEVQRAFARVCFDAEPRDEDFARLHAPRERWLMYRQMVRSRLFDMAQKGLPRTVEAITRPKFNAAVASLLAERGVRSRYLREIVHELVAHAVPSWQADPSLPAYTVDLARFEDARWRVASALFPETACEPFDFERVPVFNPTLEAVEVVHRVDKTPIAALAEPHDILVYRKPDATSTWTYAVHGDGALLVRAWRSGLSCADGARKVLADTGRAADPAFVDTLATVLSELVEQKMILGSR
jgi:hypothetical protein